MAFNSQDSKCCPVMESVKPVKSHPRLSRPLLIGTAILLWSLVACVGTSRRQQKESPSKEHSGRTVFFSSFETARDTISWYWRGDHEFAADTPPGGGSTSLRLRGGAELPTAGFITRPLKYGGNFVVQCWGKVDLLGGYLLLSTVSNHEVDQSIHINIVEDNWKFVESSDTLYCPPGKSLMLTVQSGMVLQGSILVDNIVIKKVQRPSQQTAYRSKLSG